MGQVRNTLARTEQGFSSTFTGIQMLVEMSDEDRAEMLQRYSHLLDYSRVYKKINILLGDALSKRNIGLYSGLQMVKAHIEQFEKY